MAAVLSSSSSILSVRERETAAGYDEARIRILRK
jgi:hypothetical protein